MESTTSSVNVSITLYSLNSPFQAAVKSLATLSGCSAQSTSDVGAASAYSPSNSTDYNCYAYALGETQ